MTLFTNFWIISHTFKTSFSKRKEAHFCPLIISWIEIKTNCYKKYLFLEGIASWSKIDTKYWFTLAIFFWIVINQYTFHLAGYLVFCRGPQQVKPGLESLDYFVVRLFEAIYHSFWDCTAMRQTAHAMIKILNSGRYYYTRLNPRMSFPIITSSQISGPKIFADLRNYS